MIQNPSGNITVVENNQSIPFEVKRIYYLYDVPGGEERGGHAHYELEQFIIAASGSFCFRKQITSTFIQCGYGYRCND